MCFTACLASRLELQATHMFTFGTALFSIRAAEMRTMCNTDALASASKLHAISSPIGVLLLLSVLVLLVLVLFPFSSLLGGARWRSHLLIASV